ncbi:MAG: hypothetical protein KC944_18975, partial [Candidatus Omnitrophica bacterium]|nr:hypothetical protein [Candidatus Omnitrophota bacterium]
WYDSSKSGIDFLTDDGTLYSIEELLSPYIRIEKGSPGEVTYIQPFIISRLLALASKGWFLLLGVLFVSYVILSILSPSQVGSIPRNAYVASEKAFSEK